MRYLHCRLLTQMSCIFVIDAAELLPLLNFGQLIFIFLLVEENISEDIKNLLG